MTTSATIIMKMAIATGPASLFPRLRITCAPQSCRRWYRRAVATWRRDVRGPQIHRFDRAGRSYVRTALSPLAKYRTKNAPQSAAKTAPGRSACDSSATQAAEYRSKDPAKATLLPARAACQMARHQHDQDRQHLLARQVPQRAPVPDAGCGQRDHRVMAYGRKQRASAQQRWRVGTRRVYEPPAKGIWIRKLNF